MTNQSVVGFDALYESEHKCRRNVIWKDSVAAFDLNSIRRVYLLSEALQNGKYKEGEKRYFTVTEPKRREIMCIGFRDRVYQRSLNDNAIFPQMQKQFIFDNCACQPGKGTLFARDRLKEHLRRYHRKHGHEGYVLQIDIKGYYPNMPHDTAKRVFHRGLDPETFKAAEEILDGFPGDVGFNPGSQIIQIVGISALSDLDHWCKERKRLEHYIRYMDDIIIVHESRDFLTECLADISEKITETGQALNAHKTKIYPLTKGIDFLGFTFRLTESGKVIVTMLPDKVKHERKKLFRLVAKVKSGKTTRKKADECYQSWKAHASYGNSYKMLRRMDAYYKSLYGGQTHENQS